MGHAAGELSHGLHFLRLAEQFLGLSARLVFRVAFRAAVSGRSPPGFPQTRALLDVRPFAFGRVDADTHQPLRASVAIVKDDAAPFHPAQRGIVLPNNAKLLDDLGFPCVERALEGMLYTQHVLAKNKSKPGFITTIEIAQPVQGLQIGREPNLPGLHLPFEDPESSGLLRQGKQLFAFLHRGHDRPTLLAGRYCHVYRFRSRLAHGYSLNSAFEWLYPPSIRLASVIAIILPIAVRLGR